MSTRADILRRIAAPLTPLYGEREARSIALLTAAHLSGLAEQAFLTDPRAELTLEGLDATIAQLTAGRPVQYVLGEADFYGRRFSVREGVLIPRPETEELVDWIVREEPQARTILDVGTGSGCIAATLALELPGARLFGADISVDALTIAAENCRALGAQVTLREADALHDLEQHFTGLFDVIVSNPPYVPDADFEGMDHHVRDHEPRLALFVPDDDPLLFYRAIARAGRQLLRPGGKLYFEIYYRYADAMREMLADEGYTDTIVREDLNQKPRMLCSRRP